MLDYLVVYKPELRPNLQPKENLNWISFESHEEIGVRQRIIKYLFVKIVSQRVILFKNYIDIIMLLTLLCFYFKRLSQVH